MINASLKEQNNLSYFDDLSRILKNMENNEHPIVTNVKLEDLPSLLQKRLSIEFRLKTR